MKEVPLFAGYDDTAIYTIKTVVQQTGISPATLRAWERRYGILCPDRSGGGYRLYSQRDIAMLRWLKSQVQSGVNIGRAVELLEYRCQPSGAAQPAIQSLAKALPSPAGTAGVIHQLLDHLLNFSEPGATGVLSEAFALHRFETVSEQVIVPSLSEVGERWQRGTISVVQEHFATAFLQRKLMALFNAYGQPASGPLAVTATAPGEWHDIGVLLLSIALRRQGWRVIYLGPNVPASQLAGETASLSPELLCLSATMPESAARLTEVDQAVSRLPEPRPRLVYGGRAFNMSPRLRARFEANYLGSSAMEAAEALVPA